MSIASVALSPVYQDYWNFPGRISGQNAAPGSDEILIYLTVGGSVIPLRVLESDSIASVKLRIEKCNKGFYVKKQKLVSGGKELSHNSSRVRDYGLVDGNILHLVLRLSDLQAISVRTACGKEFEFHVQRKKNVGYVKQQIASKAKGLLLNGQELYCDGEELEDQRIIDDICKSNDAVIHLLVRKSAKLRAVPVEKDFEISIVASGIKETIADVGETVKLPTATLNPKNTDFSLEPVTINSNIVLSSLIKKLIDATFDGLERGYDPIRSTEGSGGVYLMQDSSGQNFVSVFKPMDEEPMAENNPRDLPLSSDGEGLKKGTRVGEGALREVAAYILDHPRGGPRSLYSNKKGFAGVPPTVMVKCRHRGFNYGGGLKYMPEKLGSLQMFVENSGSCEDRGPRDFPVEEVHKICVLDLRLANTDRHGGNILIHKDGDKDQYVLTPIDHGYCLPQSFEDCTFEWLYWPQARQPFSPDTIAYINSLDAEKDIEILKFYGWDVAHKCERVLRISTMLLKKGAERGLTPFAIGSIMCRETLKKESVIEKMVVEAEEGVLPGTSESTFLECISVIMDQYLDGVGDEA